MLTEDQVWTFVTEGWIVVPGLVPSEALVDMDTEVSRLIAGSPPPDGHVGQHFYWPTEDESPALFRLFQDENRVLSAAEEITGRSSLELAFGDAQVALNIPLFSHRPGRPHIDGYAPGRNPPATFTLLVGLLLTDQTADNCGNLWVWPGTHMTHASFFATKGPEAFSSSGGYPDIELPTPTQVHGERGDILFAHYLLGHNIGGNFESDRTRRMVYWRLRAAGHIDRWEECLADPWVEYPRLRRMIESERKYGEC